MFCVDVVLLLVLSVSINTCSYILECCFTNDDVIKWKRFSALLALCEGIPLRSSVDCPHNGQWRGALMFSFFDLCVNLRLSKQSRRRWFGTPSDDRALYDVTWDDWVIIDPGNGFGALRSLNPSHYLNQCGNIVNSILSWLSMLIG